MILEQLLDFESQSLLLIYNFLSDSPDFHGVNEISKAIGFEKRTTEKYLDRLEDLATKVSKKTGISPLLVSEKKYRLIQDDYELAEELILKIYHLSFKINILEDLLLNKKTQISDLEFKYNLSYSSIKKNIYELRNMLLNYDLHLQIRKKELILSGLEPTIRIFFLDFFWKVYNGYIHVFNIKHTTEKEFLNEKLNLMLSDKLDPITKIQYDYLVDITLLRYFSGHRIQEKELPNESVLIGSEFARNFQLSSKKITSIYSNFEDELYFMLLFLQSKLAFFRNPRFFNLIKSSHEKFNSNIYEANQFFFHNIGLIFSHFNFDYDKLEKELYVIHTRLLLMNFYHCVPVGEDYHLYPDDISVVMDNIRVKLEKLNSRNDLIYSNLEYSIFLYAVLSIENEFMTTKDLFIFIDDSNGEFNTLSLKNFLFESTRAIVKLNFIPSNCFLLMNSSVDLIISTNRFFRLNNKGICPILYLECKDKYQDLRSFQTTILELIVRNRN